MAPSTISSSEPPYGMIHWLRTWRQASPALVQREPGILHEALDQIAGLRRLAARQAAVAGDAVADLAPHRRIVAGLDLGALAIGLLGIARDLRWHRAGPRRCSGS